MIKNKNNLLILSLLIIYFALGSIFINTAYKTSALPENNRETTPTPSIEKEQESEKDNISTQSPETQKPNIISSIGDFELYGEYIDGTKVEKNAAINTSMLGENAFTQEIIAAVRTQNGNQDMFAIFELELQQNGRPMRQHTPLDIFITDTSAFFEYENLKIYEITQSGIAEEVKISIEGQYIKFTDDELGKYVVCGDKREILTTPKPEETTPLQEGEETSIIETYKPTNSNDNNEESVVTPGAFVFWLIVAIVVGLWIGLGIGYFLWGRYRRKDNNSRGPFVIGE